MRQPPPPPITIVANRCLQPLRPENQAFSDQMTRLVRDTPAGALRDRLPFEFRESLNDLFLFDRHCGNFRFRILGDTVGRLLGRHHGSAPLPAERQPDLTAGKGLTSIQRGRAAGHAASAQKTLAAIFAPWPEFARLVITSAGEVIDHRQRAVLAGTFFYDRQGGVDFEMIAVPIAAADGRMTMGFGRVALGGGHGRRPVRAAAMAEPQVTKAASEKSGPERNGPETTGPQNKTGRPDGRPELLLSQ